ncbi:MAG: hypothetical protein AAFV07_17660 [Bacteroidota bacterium]
MTKGLFKSFVHDHYFTALEDGSTDMEDKLVFSAPLGLLGKWATHWILLPYLTRFLKIRNQAIKEFAESDRWRELPGMSS